MWENAPLMPGKKRDIIWFPICSHSLLSNQMNASLGAVVVSSPCKGFPISLWWLGEQHQWWLSVALVCCWKEAASLLQAPWSVQFPSLQWHGSRSNGDSDSSAVSAAPWAQTLSPRPVCLHSEPAQGVIRALTNCWHGNSLAWCSHPWWCDRTVHKVIACWEK